MSTSSIPFISSEPSSVIIILPFPFPSLTCDQAAPPSTLVHHRRQRSRTISLLSVKSGDSEKLSLELPKPQPTVVSFGSYKNHMARGSFVLNAPASTVLRAFLPSRHPRAYQRNYMRSLEKDWDAQPSSSSTTTPFISRTTPSTPGSRSVSPTRAQTLLRPRKRSRSRQRARPYSEIHPRDLNPIMAGLEQRSKFCENKSVCSTCNREGIAFPQCGKCRDSWCSRDCRLKGRMKHSCIKTSV
jgi:hypothetical protein